MKFWYRLSKSKDIVTLFKFWHSYNSEQMYYKNVYMHILEQLFTKSVPSTMKMKVKGGAAVDPDSGNPKTAIYCFVYTLFIYHQKPAHILTEGKLVILFLMSLFLIHQQKKQNFYLWR